MADMLQSNTLKEFRRIPGVGTAIAEDMWSVGLRSIDDLKNRDPQELYDAICTQQGTLVDRCMLYVMRCAVYYASNATHEPELLKWWHWKDKQLATEKA